MADSEDMYSSAPDSSPSKPWKDSRAAKSLGSAGKSLSASGNSMISDARDQAAAGANRQTPMYHKGGKVRKTGEARLLKGEVVIPRGKAKEGRKLLKSRKKKSRKMGSR